MQNQLMLSILITRGGRRTKVEGYWQVEVSLDENMDNAKERNLTLIVAHTGRVRLHSVPRIFCVRPWGWGLPFAWGLARESDRVGRGRRFGFGGSILEGVVLIRFFWRGYYSYEI
jgi:hypothetical protein